MPSDPALFVVECVSGEALPPDARARLAAWRAEGLEVEVFAWTGSGASGALTERLSAGPLSGLIWWGFDAARAAALARATGNHDTPATVLLTNEGPLDAAASLWRELALDERFCVVFRSARQAEGPALGETIASGLADAPARELEVMRRPRAPRPGPPARAVALTIAVPAFNAAAFLERCVRSLVRGSRAGGVEILVIDDGSTDDTGALAERLAAFAPGAVRVLHQENRGHGGAINTGLEAARGRYFRVVDADDWVSPSALAELLATLPNETADLVLTDYAEDRPGTAGPQRSTILDRLASGGLFPFEALVDARAGVTSWAVILSTSTFKTEVLRAAGLRLTEKSPYVDLEYCVMGLEHVETVRYRALEVYRYALGREEQTVSDRSYLRHYRKHEAVLTRLCELVAARPGWSEGRRRYVVERVLEPIARRHLEVLEAVVRDAREVSAFRERMRRYPFLRLPEQTSAVRRGLKRVARATLPAAFFGALHRVRSLGRR